MSPRISARERLLQEAAQRFYANGIAATGIDGIIQGAGVAKMSLYNNFGSKAELVAAYLERRHQQWLELYRERLGRQRGAQAGVLAVVDAYLDHAHMAYAHGFRGCGLLNAAAELPVGHPGRAAVARHKAEVEILLRGHLGTQDPGRAAALAEQISYLLEGAMARAGLEGSDQRLVAARRIIAGWVESR